VHNTLHKEKRKSTKIKIKTIKYAFILNVYESYNFKLAQLNVDGLTQAKADILCKNSGDAYVLTVQETHEGAIISRLNINGFDMINHISHNKHILA